MKQENLYPNVQTLVNTMEAQCAYVIENMLKEYKGGNKEAFNKTIKCLIVAWCQSGKSISKAATTGIVHRVLEKYAPEFNKLDIPLAEGIKALKGIVWMGVTDTQLWEQHQDKFSALKDYKFRNAAGKYVKMDDIVNFDYCLHYSKKENFVGKEVANIHDILEDGEMGFIILTDEAHKATGKEQRQKDFIEQFDDAPSNTPKVRVAVTATPDFLNGYPVSDIYKMFDCAAFLEPAEGYWGAEEGLKDGRFRDINGHIDWTMKKQDGVDDWVLSELYPTWKALQEKRNFKNFVIRISNQGKAYSRFVEAVRKVWTAYNEKVPAFNKYKGGTYNEFLMHCGKKYAGKHQKLHSCELRIIDQGIGAGVSIDHAVIGGWYESTNYTKNAKDRHKNMSNHVQRTLRNAGYGAGQYNYPIWCDKQCIRDYVDEMNAIKNFLLANKNPNHISVMSGTNSRVKTYATDTIYVVDGLKAFDTRKELDDYCLRETGHTSGNSIRTQHSNKDYGSSILRNKMKAHRTQLQTRPVIGKTNTWLCCVELDNDVSFTVKNKKTNTQQIWKELADTQWGNLQNKFVAVEVKEVAATHECTNDTFYAVT